MERIERNKLQEPDREIREGDELVGRRGGWTREVRGDRALDGLVVDASKEGACGL